MRQKLNETGPKHFKLTFLKLFTIYESGQSKKYGSNMGS